jgi:pimeloyl-ACP methyl ester carboxylesterase
MTDDRTGRLVAVNGVELWVRGFGSTGAPLVVLVPGAASPSDWWDVELCEAIADGGHHVLRYDLRDTGQSTTRPPGEADYTGDDLVSDLAGIIASVGRAAAHVVGLSLGGGLAQQLALSRPDLVRSLTLLSTSPGGPGSEGLPEMSLELAASFAQEPAPMDWCDRDAVHRRMLAEEELFGGTLPIDPARIRRISDSVFDRSIDLSAGSNHWTVPSASGTREQLGSITAPTLVVHGSEDPLFPPGHGEALAREIPGARLLLVPGLGHQFPPPETWPQLVPALLAHFAEADAAR